MSAGPLSTPARAYGFYDTFVETFFTNSGLVTFVDNPQFVADLYFEPPPSALPMSRPHKTIARDLPLAMGGAATHRFPFFGRSRLSFVGQNNGALTGNMTFAVYAAFFESNSTNVRYQLLSTQTINSPGGGTVHYEVQNLFCDAIEIRVTGTTPDAYMINGYVADATLP